MLAIGCLVDQTLALRRLTAGGAEPSFEVGRQTPLARRDGLSDPVHYPPGTSACSMSADAQKLKASLKDCRLAPSSRVSMIYWTLAASFERALWIRYIASRGLSKLLTPLSTDCYSSPMVVEPSSRTFFTLVANSMSWGSPGTPSLSSRSLNWWNSQSSLFP